MIVDFIENALLICANNYVIDKNDITLLKLV